MEVAITKKDSGYEVKIGNEIVTLPEGSKAREVGQAYILGMRPGKHLEIAYDTVVLKEPGKDDKTLVTDDDTAISDLMEAAKVMRGGSRLYKKTRRAKRHGRSRKQRKLGKLATRRR